jgi:hypothetical protein
MIRPPGIVPVCLLDLNIFSLAGSPVFHSDRKVRRTSNNHLYNKTNDLDNRNVWYKKEICMCYPHNIAQKYKPGSLHL